MTDMSDVRIWLLRFRAIAVAPLLLFLVILSWGRALVTLATGKRLKQIPLDFHENTHGSSRTI